MTISKSMKSLVALMVFGIVCSILPATASVRVLRSDEAIAGTFQRADIHSIKDTGLQFELPTGWNVATQENGNVVVSFEDGAASATFVVEEDYAAVISGMKQGLKERLSSLKSEGVPKEDTHNGMTHISESGSGVLSGVAVSWSIDVLKARKNVTILTFGIDKIMDAHAAEYAKFVMSLKKG